MASLNYILNFHNSLRKQYGLRASLFLLRSKFCKDPTSSIKINGIRSVISLSNFNNDVSTVFKIFFGKEYDVKFVKKPTVIIDCGANIGLSAVFFANKYPDAFIIAVEPDKTNFKFLQENTRFYKNVRCINKAVWSHATNMNIVDEGLGNWGLKTHESPDGALESVSMKGLMDEFHVDHIDLLKIDIEGAEKELFSLNYEYWLNRTSVITIELHDRYDPEISTVFFSAVRPLHPVEYRMGENYVCEFTT